MYHAQFTGSYARFNASKIWRTNVEPKCKFFTWSMLHKKILMAENLEERGWEHEGSCVLCSEVPDTVDHLCRGFPYTKKVWERVRRCKGDIPTRIDVAASVDEWWNAERARISSARKRDFDGLLIYMVWNVWKEINHQIFSHESKDEESVAFVVHEDFQFYMLAAGSANVVDQLETSSQVEIV
ncbi:hypothetical protein ACQ4PT_051550 [Festuca glaucescens]